jgi:tetratricopeptide (TPR) repeat protein
MGGAARVNTCRIFFRSAALALSIAASPFAANAAAVQTNWVERGNQATTRGDLAEALQDYTNATQQQPNDPVPWYDRALTYQSLGRIAEAIGDARRSIAERASFAEGHELLAHLSQQQGDLAQALRAADKSVELQPDNTGYRLRRALILTDLGRTGDARADYEAILRHNSSQRDALQGLAYALLNAGDEQAALPLLERYVALDPAQTDGNTIVALTDILIAHRRYAEALTYLNANPSPTPHAIENKAQALIGLGRRDEALAALASIPAGTPGSASLRGVMLFESHRCNDAARAFAEATQRDPNDELSWRNLGAAYLCANKLAPARDAFQRAIGLKPADTLALRYQADVLRRIGDLRGAVKSARAYLALGGDEPHALMALGVDEYSLGERSRAIADYERGCKLLPASDPDAAACKSQLPQMKAAPNPKSRQ